MKIYFLSNRGTVEEGSETLTYMHNPYVYAASYEEALVLLYNQLVREADNLREKLNLTADRAVAVCKLQEEAAMNDARRRLEAARKKEEGHDTI